jgi:hypothetical protein
MDANQAKLKANRKADQARMEANKEDMLAEISARMDASHKKTMFMLDAHHERIMASLRKMEATNFKADPEEMESVTQHQEVPNEEAAWGPEASCRAMQRDIGNDPRRWWIREEVGFRLQEGVPFCKTGMAKKKPLHEDLDPGKS